MGQVSDWQDQAACKGAPTSTFFPERGSSAEPARAICSTCTVAEECRQASTHEHFGVWGGLSAPDRRKLRNSLPPRSHRQPINHGTTAGYRTHIKYHEAMCWACRDANSRWNEASSGEAS